MSRGGGVELGSEQLGQGSTGWNARVLVAFEPGERGPKVVPVRLGRQRQPEEGPGLEDAAQLLRHPGHLGRVAHRLVAQEQVLVSRFELVERGLLSPEFGGAVRLTVAQCQLGQAVECGAVAGIGRDQSLQGLALRGGVPAARGEPGRQPVKLGRGRLRGRQVLERRPGLRDAAGRQRPVQAGAPDTGRRRADAAGRRRATARPRRTPPGGSPGWPSPARPGRPPGASCPVRSRNVRTASAEEVPRFSAMWNRTSSMACSVPPWPARSRLSQLASISRRDSSSRPSCQ